MKEIDWDNYYEIEGDESGSIYDCANLVEVYKSLKEVKDFDRRNGIEDSYHVYLICGDVMREVVIRKYRNRIEAKFI